MQHEWCNGQLGSIFDYNKKKKSRRKQREPYTASTSSIEFFNSVKYSSSWFRHLTTRYERHQIYCCKTAICSKRCPYSISKSFDKEGSRHHDSLWVLKQRRILLEALIKATNVDIGVRFSKKNWAIEGLSSQILIVFL